MPCHISHSHRSRRAPSVRDLVPSKSVVSFRWLLLAENRGDRNAHRQQRQGKATPRVDVVPAAGRAAGGGGDGESSPKAISQARTPARAPRFRVMRPARGPLPTRRIRRAGGRGPHSWFGRPNGKMATQERTAEEQRQEGKAGAEQKADKPRREDEAPGVACWSCLSPRRSHGDN